MGDCPGRRVECRGTKQILVWDVSKSEIGKSKGEKTPDWDLAEDLGQRRGYFLN